MHGVAALAGLQTRCDTCPARPTPETFRPKYVRKRHGARWRCKACVNRAKLATLNATMTPEQRSAKSTKGKSTWTTEQRAAWARRMAELRSAKGANG